MDELHIRCACSVSVLPALSSCHSSLIEINALCVTSLGTTSLGIMTPFARYWCEWAR